MGRKGKYETHIEPYLPKIPKMYKTMTEGQIAKKLGVSVSAWETYKNQHKELSDCLRSLREDLIEDLKSSLKMKAKGFHYKETKKTIRDVGGVRTQVIEEYEKYSPPDTGAIHLLLKNLDDEWRNEDAPTMKLKREKLELERQKAESENW